MMKIDQKWYLIAIAVVLASILLPFMQAGSFAGNVVESTVVYRDGWFGPYIERVTLDSGAVTYVDVYPWYYFKDFKPSTMDFIDISTGRGSSYVTSDHLIITTKDASLPIPITFIEQNNLYLTGRFGGFGDGPQEVTRSMLKLYKGLAKSFIELDDLSAIKWSYSTGPWKYEGKWEGEIVISSIFLNDGVGQYDYTVLERQWAKPYGNLFETIYDTDLAWITVNVVEDETPEVIERGTGKITVTVFDNQVQTPTNVDVYKNGGLLKSVYFSTGQYVFNDLEFGNYKFVVSDSGYSVKFYDAMPQQLYFDYDVGEIELSSKINTVSYFINGDFEGSTADPYKDVGAGTGGASWENTSIDETVTDPVGVIGDVINDTKAALGLNSEDGGDDDGSLSLTQILGLIAALLSSMGLLTSVAVIGLPIFVVVILFLLGAAFVKSGDKKPNQKYSPGNKKGGRKR